MIMPLRASLLAQIAACLFVLAFVAACTSWAPQSVDVDPETVWMPVMPLANVERQLDAVKLVPANAPLHTRETRFPFTLYNAQGERSFAYYDEILFPTHYTIVLSPDMDEPIVFLSRSPHGGCTIRWNEQRQFLDEPCYGSQWLADGTYREGPAGHDLDRLRSEVREGMVWISNEIIPGTDR